tara:strand:- start:54 stop:218 length:165 start_codon:yes stop_codon:yes gene_type:complete
MTSFKTWCFAYWPVSLLKRFIIGNAHTKYGAFFLYVSLFAAMRQRLTTVRASAI